jgi:hypothetical protein
VALVVVAAASPARAQSVHGRVVDERGTPVERAEVVVLPFGQPTFTDADGGFDLGAMADGAYRIRVRRVGFKLTFKRVVLPLAEPNLTIVLPHAPLALDTIHTTALEQQLPRMFDRLHSHTGAALYGPALDSTFARGGSRSLTDMLTIDRSFAMILRRPHCGATRLFVDDVLVPGSLDVDGGAASPRQKAGRTAMDVVNLPANPEMYIDQKDIAAIEVFDSPDGVHEPGIDSDPISFPPGKCKRIVLIWSKYYQQQHWAGH